MSQDRTLIVPATHVEAARALALKLEGGDNMFPREATDGNSSFYASSGTLTPLTAEQLPCQSWEFDGEEWVVTHDHPGDLPALAARMNATPEEAAALQSLLGVVDISDQPWQQALDRLGLVLVPDEDP